MISDSRGSGSASSATAASAAGAARVRARKMVARVSQGPGAPQLVVLVLTIVLISTVHNYLGGLRALRPALVLMVSAVLATLISHRNVRPRHLKKYWPMRALAAIGVMACLSAVLGLSLGGSARFILDSYSKTLLLAVLVVISVRHAADLRRLIWAYVIGCGVLAWMAFDFGISKEVRVFGYDANDVGLVVLTGLPLTLFTYQMSRFPGKVLSLVLAMSIAAALAASESRGAFVGLVCVGAGLLFVARNTSLAKRLMFVVVAAAGIGVAAPATYWDLMSSLTDVSADYNWDATFGRKQVAERGLSYMLTHPVAGVGIGNFSRAEGTISEIARNDPTGGTHWVAAHNSYIEMAAEMGVPGLALWVAILWGSIFHLGKLARGMPVQWARGSDEQRTIFYAATYLPIALLGFAVSSTFLSFAYRDTTYLLVALVVGAMAAHDEYRARSALMRPRQGQGAVPRMMGSGRRR